MFIGNNDDLNQVFVNDKDLESYIFNSAKYYASKLVKNGYYSFYDFDDLEQEAQSRKMMCLHNHFNLLVCEAQSQTETSLLDFGSLSFSEVPKRLKGARSAKERSKDKFLLFFIIELKSIIMMILNLQ